MDTTLTVGADGKFAGPVVPALAARGAHVFDSLLGNPLTLRAILGREPRALRRFLP